MYSIENENCFVYQCPWNTYDCLEREKFWQSKRNQWIPNPHMIKPQQQSYRTTNKNTQKVLAKKFSPATKSTFYNRECEFCTTLRFNSFDD